jgi:hypothetical protein
MNLKKSVDAKFLEAYICFTRKEVIELWQRPKRSPLRRRRPRRSNAIHFATGRVAPTQSPADLVKVSTDGKFTSANLGSKSRGLQNNESESFPATAEAFFFYGFDFWGGDIEIEQQEKDFYRWRLSRRLRSWTRI